VGGSSLAALQKFTPVTLPPPPVEDESLPVPTSLLVRDDDDISHSEVTSYERVLESGSVVESSSIELAGACLPDLIMAPDQGQIVAYTMDLIEGTDPEASGFHTVPLASGDILVPDTMNVVRSTQLASELESANPFSRQQRTALGAPACTPL